MRIEPGTIEAHGIKAIYVDGVRCTQHITAIDIGEPTQNGNRGHIEYTPMVAGRFLTDGEDFVTCRISGEIRLEK